MQRKEVVRKYEDLDELAESLGMKPINLDYRPYRRARKAGIKFCYLWEKPGARVPFPIPMEIWEAANIRQRGFHNL